MPVIPEDFAFAACRLLGVRAYHGMLEAQLDLSGICTDVARRGLLVELHADDTVEAMANLAVVRRYAARLWRSSGADSQLPGARAALAPGEAP